MIAASVPHDNPAFIAAVHVIAEKAHLALPLANGRITKAVEIVLSGGVTRGEHGYVVQSQSRAEVKYSVNGTCGCRDAAEAPHGGLCKHRLACAVVRRAEAQLATQAVTEADETALDEPPAPGTSRIPAQYLKQIHGKPFILYAGLLQMAHEAGLMRLEARFISVTSELALAEATATFADGRVFTEAADSTPSNCGEKIRLHFPRMALTRAKARALRDALVVHMCAVEEIAD